MSNDNQSTTPIGGQRILLGVTGETISALAEEPEEVSDEEGRRFDRELSNALSGHRESTLPRIAGGAH